MKIYKAYPVRLYPTLEQKILLSKTFGCSRFVYNYFLGRSFTSAYACNRELPSLQKEYPWLKEVDGTALRHATSHLEAACQRFSQGLSEAPRYKRYGVHPSYTSTCMYSQYKDRVYASIQLDVTKKTLKLPKLKEVKYRGYRSLKQLDGKIKSVTVRQVTGRYYASILVETEINRPAFSPRSLVGIDLGIKDLVITSDGEKIPNPKNYAKYERKLKGLQRSLSRKIKGSHNYVKAKEKLARLYLKIKNARKFYFHQVTNHLLQENDVIFMEHLHSKEMMQSHSFAKSIGDASFYTIKQQLEYKCLWENKRLIQISSYYPSSQRCSCCGKIDQSMKEISKRVYECNECGIKVDRDVNASFNILEEGIALFIKQEYQMS